MRLSDWSTLSRLCVRHVFRCSAFSLAPLLAPSPPLSVSRFWSATSQLLQRSPTSPGRASSACGFRLPDAAYAKAGIGGGETSRFPCKECRRVPGVSDHAEPVHVLAMAHVTVLPSRFTARSALESPLSRLNTQPTTPVTNASPVTSRSSAHGTGPVRQATPSPYRTCIYYFLPAFPAHGQSGEEDRGLCPQTPTRASGPGPAIFDR